MSEMKPWSGAGYFPLTFLLVVLVSAALIAGCSRESPEDQFIRAQQALERGDHAEAIVRTKVVLQSQPDRADARLLLGKALLAAGDAPLAAVELTKARDLGAPAQAVTPPLAVATALSAGARQTIDQFSKVELTEPEASVALKTTLAAAHIALKEIPRAEALVDEALSLNAESPEAQLLKFRLVAGRTPAQARPMVEAFLQKRANHVEAMQLLGELILATGGSEASARELFDAVLRIDPRHAPGHMALIGLALTKGDSGAFGRQVDAMKAAIPDHPETRFQQARHALIEGRQQAARDLLLPVLRTQPDSARALQLMGAVELEANSLVAAERHLAKAVQIAPDAVGARLLLARTYLRLSEPQRTLAVLQPMLALPQPGAMALSLAGDAHLQAGRLDEAERTYRRAAASAPTNAQLQTALALTRIAKGQDAEGLEQLRGIAARDTGSHADLALITTQMRRNELQAALQSIDRLQTKLPEASLPHALRGDVQLRLRDLQAARKSYDKALALAPKDFSVIQRMATLDVRDGNASEAERRVETYWTAEKRDHAALRMLVELRQRRGAPASETRALIEAVIAKHPTDALPRILLVEQHLRSRDPSTALTAAQQAIAANPDDPELQALLARVQLEAGEGQQAIATLSRLATDRSASASVQLQLAQAHATLRDYRQAREVLRRIIGIDPRNRAGQLALGRVEIIDKRPDEAVRVARSLQQQDPTDLSGYALEADALKVQGRLDQVVGVWRTAFGRRPETETAVRLHDSLIKAGQRGAAEQHATQWRQRYPGDMAFVTHLGTVAVQAGDWGMAETHYRLVAERAPDDPVALNNLAYALAKQGKPEATSMARKAVSLRGDDPRMLNTLALALSKGNQLPDALKSQRRAVELGREAPVYRLQLAELLVQAGDKDAARTELEALRRLGGRFSEHAKVTEMLAKL
jgi:putative PEP-CTERM system TPR-repeat lipoprotein